MNYPSYDEKYPSEHSDAMPMKASKVTTPTVLESILIALEEKNSRFSDIMDRLESILEQVIMSESSETAGTLPREQFATRFENNAADLLVAYELRLSRLSDILDRIRV